MVHRILVFAAFLGILAGAVYLRVPGLEQRPMHNDEGVNTIKFRELWQSGRFDYDPNEYHGPTLFYLTYPSVWVSGAKDFTQTTEFVYRIVPVAFGIALILLTFALGKHLGWGAALWACALTAASPAMVYYSRYYIHEMLLVCFTLAGIVCGWRYWISGKWSWAILTGAAAGMMWATKETWVLPVVAAAGAIGLTWLVERLWPSAHAPMRASPGPIAAAAGVALVVAAIWFSGFFTRPAGMLDAVTTYKAYLSRGSGGHIHDHPFDWYLRLLWWHQSPVARAVKVNRNPVFTEAVILGLAGLGAVLAFMMRNARRATAGGRGFEVVAAMKRDPNQNVPESPEQPIAAATSAPAGEAAARRDAGPAIPLVRFLAFYTLLLTLIYSMVPYKTPWCALGFLDGMILLAGFAAARIVQGAARLALALAGSVRQESGDPYAWLAGALAAGAVMWFVWQPFSREKKSPPWAITPSQAFVEPGWSLWSQSRAASLGRWAADKHNPWVYAHTTADVFTAVKRMREIAEVRPAADGELVTAVVTIDSWPMPWYFRGMKGIGWWPSYQHFAAQMNAKKRLALADVMIGPEELSRKLSVMEDNFEFFVSTSGKVVLGLDGMCGPWGAIGHAAGMHRAMQSFHYEPSPFGLRPGVVLWMMIREPVFEKLRQKWERESAQRRM